MSVASTFDLVVSTRFVEITAPAIVPLPVPWRVMSFCEWIRPSTAMLPLTSIVPAAISQPLKGAALPHPWMSTSGTDRSEDGEDGVSGLPEYVSTNTIPLGGGDVKVTFPPGLVG